MIWHLITGEYPPDIGGVGDYTRLLGDALSRCGDEVHVWAPPGFSSADDTGAVRVHRLPDHFGPRSMLAMESRTSNSTVTGTPPDLSHYAFIQLTLNVPARP